MLKELNEKRIKLVAEARTLLGKAGATAEDIANANKMLDDSDAIKIQIDTEARAEAAEKELRTAAPATRQALKTASADPAERAEQETRAWKDYARNGEMKMLNENREILNVREAEIRANEMV